MLVSACSDINQMNNEEEEGKLTVVTSLYPLYDFVQKIGGDQVHVTPLVPVGVDPHDWTPKLKDITNISETDVFIYIGAGFERWIDSILDSVEMDGLVAEASMGITLIKAADEIKDDHHGGYDPHVWTSPKQAMIIAENIVNVLIEADPDQEALFKSNYDELIHRLEALDEEIREVVEHGDRQEIVVSHQSFAYLARDYQFEQIPIMGLSPQAEPTVKDLQRITEFIEVHGIQYILFEELVSPRLAETLAADLHIETLVLNPLEGLTTEQQTTGEDYFSIMNENIETLRMALQK